MSQYPLIVGRYALFDPIASGGMASVHIGRLLGSFGFARTVAIKRLHPEIAQTSEFLTMFLAEARLAARIHHTNVVQTLDVVALENELLLVMEYISGAALSQVLAAERKAGELVPHRIAVDIMVGVLNGLQAAHEAKDESGEPLQIVHRDVSPQNILVGADGVVRLLDFGIAKAVGGHVTQPNQIKGKLRYMSPETLTAQALTRASDIYSASVVLWEMLAGRRLFAAEKGFDVVREVLHSKLESPSSVQPHLSHRLDEIVMRGLDRNPAYRYATARDMALELEAAVAPVNRSAISEWVNTNAGAQIRERAQRVAQIEREVGREGNAAAHRLQDGGAVSAEYPVDQRTSMDTTDTGTAPSLSVENPQVTPPARRPRSAWLLMGSVAFSALFVAGLFERSRASAHNTLMPTLHLAPHAPSLSPEPKTLRLASHAPSLSPEPKSRLTHEAVPRIFDPLELPLAETAPVIALVAASSQPKKLASTPPARLLRSELPLQPRHEVLVPARARDRQPQEHQRDEPKPIPGDRIYRRD